MPVTARAQLSFVVKPSVGLSRDIGSELSAYSVASGGESRNRSEGAREGSNGDVGKSHGERSSRWSFLEDAC